MYKNKKVVSIEIQATIIVTAALNKHFNIVGCDLNDKAYNVMQKLLQCQDKNYEYDEEMRKFLSCATVALAKEEIDYKKLSAGKDWNILARIAKQIKKTKKVADFYSASSTLARSV